MLVSQWIGVAQSLVKKRDAQVFSHAEAEATVAEFQRLERFRRAVMTLETAIIEIIPGSP